ncbi:MAG: hypothetical protein ACKOEP_05855 [Phycisphaerales bacterium]
MRLRTLILAIVALASFALPSTAVAQGGGKTPDPRPFALFRDMFDTAGEWHGPWVNMSWQPQLEWSWQSDGVPKNNFNAQVAWQAYVWFTPEVTMNVNMTFEQVENPQSNNQWFMYGEGVTAGDVWVQWSDQRTGIIGGRYTAPFGLAPLVLPGVFDTNFVNNYNFGGLMGGLATLSTGDEGGGIHALNAGFFGIDTTFMADGLFASPAAPSGPGTGGGVDSWVIGYSGANIPLLYPTLDINIAYINFGEGIGASAQQQGFNAVSYWQYMINNDGNETLDAKYWSIGPLFEYVHFWNNNGVQDASADYYTFGLITNYGNWQADATVGWQNLVDPGAGNQDNFLFTANLGYNFFGPQSLVQVGYAYEESAGTIDHQIGIQVNFPIVALEYFPMWN